MLKTVRKQASNIKKAFFEYETNKIVQINSIKIGILLRFFQCIIITYIVGYVMIYMHGYQDFHGLTSSVVVKVKGIGFANRTNVHRQIWDISDLIVPPQEKSAVFITTNAIETANQTQTTCPEDPSVPGAKCSQDTDCQKHKPLLLGNGVMTGKCVLSNSGKKTCEIIAWCPLENDTIVDQNKPLLYNVPDFTIFIKNTIIFDYLNIQRSNLFAWENHMIPKHCTFDNKDILLKYCPIFKISSFIGPLNDHDLKQLLIYGGIIQMIITWNCNLDHSEDQCKPVYSFKRLDPKDGKLSKGWNFRYSNYYVHDKKEYRVLYKVFGLRIVIEVRGKALKFSPITLTMNLGSGVALLAVATLICDFIIIFILPHRDKYFKSKYELHEDDDAYQDPTENDTVSTVEPVAN